MVLFSYKKRVPFLIPKGKDGKRMKKIKMFMGAVLCMNLLTLSGCDRVVQSAVVEEKDQTEQKKEEKKETVQKTVTEQVKAPENQKIGAMLASKWNQTETDMAILLPEKGVSMIDAEGQPFDGVEERKALFDAIENGIDNGHVEIIKLDCNINDKLFAETAAQKLIDLMEKK